MAISTFLDKINKVKDSISLNETFEILYETFINILSIKNEFDVSKIENFLKSLFLMLNNDWSSIEKKLIQMFSSIKIYKEKEEKKLKKKLAKVKYIFIFIIHSSLEKIKKFLMNLFLKWIEKN